MIQKLRGKFRTYRGSHWASRIARRMFDRSRIHRLFGINLIAFSFVASVVAPQVGIVKGAMAVADATPAQVVITTQTNSQFRWPLDVVNSVTTWYSFYHPGIDLAASEGSNIHPVADGKITDVEWSPWGYGRMVIIDHGNNMWSRYAHLSFINVKVGQEITKDKSLGGIGHTGWATGSHLHLEIYQNNHAINPLEVLPKQ